MNKFVARFIKIHALSAEITASSETG